MSDLDLDELRSELDELAAPKKDGGRSPREERVIAGFEDIQRFVEQHGRAPLHGEERDIFERLYAVRLDRLRALPEYHPLLASLDHQRLLTPDDGTAGSVEQLDDDALAAELSGVAGTAEITALRHVRSTAEKRTAEELAKCDRCADFEHFKPIFDQVKRDLDLGVRTTRPFVKDAGFLKADIVAGQVFILGGQTAYVAEVGEEFRAPNGETDARLRVIYSNGTESNLLRRSLQRALYKDEAGRRITEPDAGPLFADTSEEGDLESGTVYVLRSKSGHPTIAANRSVLHKIGVTGGDVARRVANAKFDPTFLMAEVEIAATYQLFNINRSRFENLVHRVFGAGRLNAQITDRFGHPIEPREWFLVPLGVIDEAISRIRDGTIIDYAYDAPSASLVRQSS